MSSWAGTGPRALLPSAQSNILAVGAETPWTLTQRVESQSQKPWEEKARGAQQSWQDRASAGW